MEMPFVLINKRVNPPFSIPIWSEGPPTSNPLSQALKSSQYFRVGEGLVSSDSRQIEAKPWESAGIYMFGDCVFSRRTVVAASLTLPSFTSLGTSAESKEISQKSVI